jgi:enterochelin esterase family protein
MVFQDGGGYVDENGEVRAPIVFDNLISRGELPPIIGIFINPGALAPKEPGGQPGSNRSVEYDTLSDDYVRFLTEEIIPEVGRSYNLSQAAADHAICGCSSGGICAFTAAWHRPDVFSKVLSHVGSFADIRGGHVYPFLVRKTKPAKPIRVFLQGSSNDLDCEWGNWWLANLQMAAALKFAGYDVATAWDSGNHSLKNGGAILPDSLRWLWRR